MSSKIWLIIWRFQLLHKGHILLINTSLQDNPQTLVLVGSINQENKENPYSYRFRRDIITSEFPEKNIVIWGIPDFPDDLKWWEAIIDYIPANITQVVLYCWDKKNDSAVQSLISLKNKLPFDIKIIEIPRSIIPLSATQVREWIEQKNIEKLKESLWEKTLKKLLNEQ